SLCFYVCRALYGVLYAFPTRRSSDLVSVELWQSGNSVFGLLDFADGLQGDTPTGLLQDAAFDPVSGRVSFKARLTVGLHYCRQQDRKSTRLNSSHEWISYAVFCLKKK